MIYKDIVEVANLVINDPTIRIQNIIILVFIILIALIISPFASFLLYVYYFSGFIVCFLFIKYQRITTVFVKRLIYFYQKNISSRKRKLTTSCSICDDLSCIRHQRIKSVSPWRNLFVNRELNESLHKFYNKLIDDFVASWYSQFTEDASFLNELRFCLRYASASVIIRYREIDSAQLLANKLIPCLIKHIDDYVYVKQFAKLKNVKENDATLNYLGNRLHFAAANRNNELSYLRHLVTNLLTKVLPESYVNCKNFQVLIREILSGWVLLPLMDLIADPNIINLLVLVTLSQNEQKSSKITASSVTKEVEFLDGFVGSDCVKNSPFSIDLKVIKTNNDTFYALMQFLKKEGHVHLLQFNLSADEFNLKLLNPELTPKQLRDLHTDAVKIYNEYLSKESYNFIGCSTSESDELRNLIINEGVYNINTLRTCKAWYTVQDHVINLLENVWLPQFFRSNEFLCTICGTKITSTYNKNATLSNKKKYCDGSPQSGTVSKISSGLGKIRGVLKSNQAMEGTLLQNVDDALDDIFPANYDLFRDLSTWQVSISSYQYATNKVLYFNVNVQKIDGPKSNWTVLRKSQDFFMLKAKLVEFHGETEICDSPLPSRRSGQSIEENMRKFESFLVKLLQNPTLRGSDLLYTFLTHEGDLTVLMEANVPIIQDFGNIYQSVAYKLRKEKGQYLDNFMNTLLNSSYSRGIEIGSEFETVIVDSSQVSLPLPKTFRNYIFNDNFGIKYDNLNDSHSGWSFMSNGITQSIFYLLKHIMKVNNVILKLYMAFCNVAHEFVEYISTIFIKYILKKGLSQTNLTYLIKLLEESLFQERHSPNKLELEERKQNAMNKLKECINTSRVGMIIGRQTLLNSTVLLELLQNPQYNKQIVYNLLDLLLYEMYPSIGEIK